MSFAAKKSADSVGLGTPTNFSNSEAVDVVYASGSAYATLSLGANGVLNVDGNESSQTQTHWLNPQGGMDEYEVEVVKNSGSTPTGSSVGAGTWMSLGTVRSWSQAASGGSGIVSCYLTLTIRRIGTTTPTWISSSVLVFARSADGPPP